LKLRNERIKRIKDNPEISVLILGAGINGIGTFRDLAFQGMDVVMVDRGDYCSGASAASSHMVHGGIRYLENGEFRLVREAVHERNRLIENAPHLVRPLQTTFPIFKFFSGLLNAPLKFLGLLDRPSERGAIVLKIGMMLYDFFTRNQRTVPPHVFRNKSESLSLFPSLNPEIIYTGTYYDGSMPSPERIAVELIQDAVNANDCAIPLNYVGLASAGGNTLSLRDELSGEVIHLLPKILVNATGPWIDLVNQTLGLQTHFIGGTKGSHIVLDHPELRQAIRDHEFFFENKDGRIVLIFPLQDKVMIGTSDFRVDDPDHVAISEEEVNYFFNMVKRVFPTINIDRSQIVYTFSGVRPLQYSTAGRTGQISREHKVQILEAGDALEFPVLSLVGGKWTSFRAFAQETTDEVLARLGLQRRTRTEDLAIGGGNNYPETEAGKQALLAAWQEEHRCSRERIEVLFQRYGTRAKNVLMTLDTENDRALETYPDVSHGEIKFLVEHEDVVHLDDLIFRRSMLGKLGLVTEDGLHELAQLVAEICQWNTDRENEEYRRVVSVLRENHLHFNRYIRQN